MLPVSTPSSSARVRYSVLDNASRAVHALAETLLGTTQVPRVVDRAATASVAVPFASIQQGRLRNLGNQPNTLDPLDPRHRYPSRNPFGIDIIRARVLDFVRDEARNRPRRLAQFRQMDVDFTRPWACACDRLTTALSALNDADVGADKAGSPALSNAVTLGTARCRKVEAALGILLPDAHASIRERVGNWAREGRLTVLLDVVDHLRPLFVDGRMTLDDVARAIGTFEQEASRFTPDLRRPSCRSRALLRMRLDDADGDFYRYGEVRSSAVGLAEAGFDVYAEIVRRENRLEGLVFPGQAWGMMRSYRLPECFGHRLSIAWFDAFVQSRIFLDWRFSHVFSVVQWGFDDIRRRGAFSYAWLETVPRDRPFFQLLGRARVAMQRASENISWTFECHRYDYPRINPLTDALIHDSTISNERAQHVLRMLSDFHTMHGNTPIDAVSLQRCLQMLLSPAYSDTVIDSVAALTAKARMALLCDDRALESMLNVAVRRRGREVGRR